ncbi:uncharacterized protein METZ01_LOCUS504860, partial [marine metagenome]
MRVLVKENLVCSNYLETMILKTDWTDRERFYSLRRQLRQQAEKLSRSWSSLPEREDRLREKILDTSAEDLQAWRIWLEWEKSRSRPSFGRFQRGVIR